MEYNQRPSDDECFDFHRNYVALVPDGNILETLVNQLDSATTFIERMPTSEFEVIHPPYGWKVRTVIEHCCDAERVFGYRCMRFASGENIELPGWDENHFASSGYGDAQDATALATEFAGLRSANISLLRRLQPAAWDVIGVADGRKVSVRTSAWLMAGHWAHHEAILRKRLGLSG